jgi:hypothetical protein
MRVHAFIPTLTLISTLLATHGVAAQSRDHARENTVAMATHFEEWPQGATSIEEEKGLTLFVGTPKFEPALARETTGYRILNLVVQPGEELRFKLASEESKVSMRAYIPVPRPDYDWWVALRQVNNTFKGVPNRPHIEIQNTTKVPQTFGLVVFGHHGYKYRVDLERVPAVKKD